MTFKVLLLSVLRFELRMICCTTYYEIGIYSNCTGKSNRTQLNIDAELVSDFNREMIQGIKARDGSRINATLIFMICNTTMSSEDPAVDWL